MFFSAEVSYWTYAGQEERSVINAANGWEFLGCRAVQRQLGLDIPFRLVDNTLVVPLTELVESGRCLLHELVLWPELVAGHEGDGWSQVLPSGCGMLLHHRDKAPAESQVPVFMSWLAGHCTNMSVYGATNGSVAKAVVIDGGRYDVFLRQRRNWGDGHEYSTAPAFQLRDFPGDRLLREELSLSYYELRGGFEAIAACYRDYMLRTYSIPTLAEKAATNPALEYATRAIPMRCRMSVKPLPVQILEQTPETQPPVNVFLTFANIRAILRECARQQAGPVDCNLVGWNFGGHDGAFPQIFPIEPLVGGEDEMLKTIACAKELGIPIGVHDNYLDSYTVANTFSWRRLFRRQDMRPHLCGKFGGGQSFQVCPRCALENAHRNFRDLKHLGLNGTYYVDELSLFGVKRCFDPEHPCTRRENAYLWMKLLQDGQDIYGVSMSEGAHDWALPGMDRAYCVDNSADLPDYVDEGIPLFQLAYHGVMLYTSFRSSVNAYPGHDMYLRNIAYGGMPLIYWHCHFNPDTVNVFGWDVSLEYTFGDDEHLRREVARIKAITDDFARLQDARFAFMTAYRQLTPTLTETIYGNGLRCWVNFGQDDVRLEDGTLVPARNFTVSKP